MITFSNPWFLIAGAALAFLVVGTFLSRAGRRRRLADFLGGIRAARRLSRRDLLRVQCERIALVGLAALALATAAAGPAWVPPEAEAQDQEEEIVESASGADVDAPRVVVAVDVSSSMQATDVAPNRVGAAGRIAEALVASMAGSEVGLLLFAGKSYSLSPPTGDHRALAYMLRGVTPSTATPWDSGARLSAGIREGMRQLAGLSVGAVKRPATSDAGAGASDGDGADPAQEGSFGGGEIGEGSESAEAGNGGPGPGLAAVDGPIGGSIVLISDGAIDESPEDALGAVGEAVARGIEVHAIGVGSPEDESVLRRVAELGGGTYTYGAAAAGEYENRSGGGLFGSGARATSESPAPWSGTDIIFWLVVAGVFLLLADSGLDGDLGRWRRSGARRPTGARGSGGGSA